MSPLQLSFLEIFSTIQIFGVKGGQTRVDWAPRETPALQHTDTRTDRRRVTRAAAPRPGRQGLLSPCGRRKGSGPHPCPWPLTAQCAMRHHAAVSAPTPTLRHRVRPHDVVALAAEPTGPPLCSCHQGEGLDIPTSEPQL
jgi:hypothetical protein